MSRFSFQRPLMLLRAARFGPFFLTQFATSVNENLFRNVLLLLVAFLAVERNLPADMSAEVFSSLAAALFILPYFLFSTIAGQLADRMDKALLMQRIKIGELLVMLLATLVLISGSFIGLLLISFILGILSAFFTAIKYSVLPEQLRRDELVAGTALVGLGTFLAVLVGTLVAGMLMILPGTAFSASLVLLGFALAGYLSSRRIPMRGPANPDLPLRFNIIEQTGLFWSLMRRDRLVFQCMVGISWFWFLATAYLAQFPNYASQALNADEALVTMMLAVFTIGIGAGALVCERFSGRRIELGLVPIGGAGLTLAGIDLYLATPARPPEEVLELWAFVAGAGGWRILLDLLAIGVAAGLFIVPLYAWVQRRIPLERRARTIAGLNIMNSALMVLSALLGAALLGGLEIPIRVFFLGLAVVNGLVLLVLVARLMIRA